MKVAASLELRISDNVLDEGQWPIVRLAIIDGRVARKFELHAGAHSTDGMPGIGAGLQDIAAWLAYDGTGRHPEIGHDCRTPGGPWSSPSEDTLRALLGMSATERV